jgi:hypothetical protein
MEKIILTLKREFLKDPLFLRTYLIFSWDL